MRESVLLDKILPATKLMIPTFETITKYRICI